MRKIAVLCLIIIGLLSCESNNAQQSGNYQTVPVADFRKLMQEHKNFQLLDVRTPGEYMEEHLEGALNIDYNNEHFADQLNQLDKNKTTFIYCMSGGRSNNALAILQKKGFKEVYNMKGGILEWKGNQFPLTKNVFNGWKGMTKEDYDKLIHSDVPTLIDFRAKWCGPCKQLKPILDEIQKEYEGKIKIVEIDIDENKSLADDMRVMNIPLLIYYKNGEVVINIEGYEPKEDLIKSLGLR